jgi:hypothetical protein
LDPEDSLPPGDLFHCPEKEQKRQEEPDSPCRFPPIKLIKKMKNYNGINRRHQEFRKGKPFYQSVLTDPDPERTLVFMQKEESISNDAYNNGQPSH